mmetsp:Transcript_30046/g.66064  ORF Transcript_30046/g.66064 Transcript_30046/m.66064 type:complete len:92 (-) Transcript_30046:51-326(-)
MGRMISAEVESGLVVESASALHRCTLLVAGYVGAASVGALRRVTYFFLSVVFLGEFRAAPMFDGMVSLFEDGVVQSTCFCEEQRFCLAHTL